MILVLSMAILPSLCHTENISSKNRIDWEQSSLINKSRSLNFTALGLMANLTNMSQTDWLPCCMPSEIDPKSWLEKGNKCYNNNDFAGALECYTEAIKWNPENPDLWYNKGNALLGLKQYDDALEAYDTATRLDPNYSLAWQAKCVILNSRKSPKAADVCSKMQP
jgi:tetratricopeptide (TPR) repeat protein